MSKGYWRLKKIYGDNMKLIRIDTDAFHLIFYHVDIYAEIAKSVKLGCMSGTGHLFFIANHRNPVYHSNITMKPVSICVS